MRTTVLFLTAVVATSVSAAGLVHAGLGAGSGASYSGAVSDERSSSMFALRNDSITATNQNVQVASSVVVTKPFFTVNRTARSIVGLRISYDVTTSALPDGKITVRPDRFTLEAYQSIELTITVEWSAATAQYVGEIRLTPTRAEFPPLHLLVAVVPETGVVTIDGACGPSVEVSGANGSRAC